MINVVTVEQMRAAERRAIKNIEDEISVIERVAMAIFDVLSEDINNKNVCIVCGKGNNGADGFALACLLPKAKVFPLFEDGSEANTYYRRKAERFGVEAVNNIDPDQTQVIIDAVCGIGFKGYPKGAVLTAIESINSLRKDKYVIALDVPSGLDSDTGEAQIAVQADMTVCVQGVKLGSVLQKRDYSGKLLTIDCGINIEEEVGEIVDDEYFKRNIRDRQKYTSKRDYGYVGVLGGCQNYVGAVSLAANALAALRSGCGVSRVIVPQEIAALVRGFAPEPTVFELEDMTDESLKNAVNGLNTLSVGMGWGRTEDRVKALENLLSNFDGRLIIDADALFALKRLGVENLLKARKKPILTPHRGEFVNLFGIEPTLENVKESAKKYNCVILSKGATTIVSDGVKTLFSLSGTSGMATAGSGDVLSGVIAALDNYTQDPAVAAALGAYTAGLAGEQARSKYGDMGMIASDSIKELAFVFKRLCER